MILKNIIGLEGFDCLTMPKNQNTVVIISNGQNSFFLHIPGTCFHPLSLLC